MQKECNSKTRQLYNVPLWLGSAFLCCVAALMQLSKSLSKQHDLYPRWSKRGKLRVFKMQIAQTVHIWNQLNWFKADRQLWCLKHETHCICIQDTQWQNIRGQLLDYLNKTGCAFLKRNQSHLLNSIKHMDSVQAVYQDVKSAEDLVNSGFKF